ncbi:hypothetical protein HJD18_03490 [Thermoleophilia bacterium SCSIO 60948]|nr:hypothetical protein HJD18_03490 [Thermoleophilia bacterium SCSIO 60948]
MAVSAACALGWFLIDGGSRDSEPPPPTGDPKEVVEAAGASTFARDALRIRISVDGPDDDWTGEGIIDPGSGRFRLALEPAGAISGFTRIVGRRGTGFDSTFGVTPPGEFGGANDERCWFNTHNPIGYFGSTASAEESVRATGSILESLESETLAATGAGPDFGVRLAPSAASPRPPAGEANRRVWGARRLLGRIEGPIEVRAAASGEVAGMNFVVPPSKPVLQRMRQQPEKFDRPLSSSIAVSLAPSPKALTLRRPDCFAIE